MGRMSDLDIERQEQERDDGGWCGQDDGEAVMAVEAAWHEQLQAALSDLLRDVANGVEFPDASINASTTHQLRPFDSTIIARAYDWLDETATADFARAVEVGIKRAQREEFDL